LPRKILAVTYFAFVHSHLTYSVEVYANRLLRQIISLN